MYVTELDYKVKSDLQGSLEALVASEAIKMIIRFNMHLHFGVYIVYGGLLGLELIIQGMSCQYTDAVLERLPSCFSACTGLPEFSDFKIREQKYPSNLLKSSLQPPTHPKS